MRYEVAKCVGNFKLCNGEVDDGGSHLFGKEVFLTVQNNVSKNVFDPD